jgi:hypothetical protein
MTKEEAFSFEKSMKNRPHVVILGAGASVATIPNGDRNGKKISVMNDFLNNLGLSKLLDGVSLKTNSTNIEDIYCEISERTDLAHIKIKIENEIYQYFSDITIPDDPTVYDHLLSSLRKKDLIATFNWDPLLLQAYQRVSKITNDLPDLSFLHGNVLIGLCEEHKRGGYLKNRCPVCKKNLEPIKLLYPIRNKDYNNDLYNRDSWNALKNYLSRAYIVTLFGYSAPPSDIEAINLLKEAWGDKKKRNLEEIEIIDIKDKDEIEKTWEPFIFSHHYQITNSFYKSMLGFFPRRSCECTFDQFMSCKWLDAEKGLSNDMTWEQTSSFFDKILEDEKNNSTGILDSIWTIK